MANIDLLSVPGGPRPAISDSLPTANPGPADGQSAQPSRDSRLRAAAVRFEAAFLAEMLRHSGLGKMPSGFNGGAGEAAFTGSLIQEYATQIARAGGVGLAENIFKAMIERGTE